MDDPVQVFDIARMFLGDAPPLFLAEILFRTVLIYAYALLLLRWIGGRSLAQLSVVEFLLVIALGSAVGDATFYPDVPLLHAMAVITTVVLIDKIVDVLMRRFRRAKQVFDGSPAVVMRDGRIHTDLMRSRQLGDLELMEMLREAGIENMGQVRVAYLEPGGRLSVFKADQPRPGLRVEPPVELTPYPAPEPGKPVCCIGCGAALPPHPGPCGYCGDTQRTVATLPLGAQAERCTPAPDPQGACAIDKRG